MTKKEELEKEAEEWLCNNLHSASEEDFIKAMVDIVEPREKQIQIDAEHIRALQKQNGELTDKVKELEEKLGDIQMQKAGEKSDLVWRLKTANEQKAEQLTKAIELLKWALHSDPEHDEDFEKKWSEAEQFLSDVEK